MKFSSSQSNFCYPSPLQGGSTLLLYSPQLVNLYLIKCESLAIGEGLYLGIFRSLGYEKVYLPLCKVADTPFHIQRDDLTGPGVVVIGAACRVGAHRIILRTGAQVAKENNWFLFPTTCMVCVT